MLFRRTVLCALLVGALSGLLLSAVQRWQVIPLIHSAERFEDVPAASVTASVHEATQPHTHAGHAHDDHSPASHAETGEWSPTDGAQRTGYTVLANVMTATGFALVMLAAVMCSLKRDAAAKLDWRCGLLWGAAGYAAFFAAPALGLPPEIPGAAVAPLDARQLWWVFAAASTAAGLAGAAFAKAPWRWAALGLLVVPHVMGAPHLASGPFAGYPPTAAAELTELARQFVWATALANAAFWLVLGSASVWAVRRFLKQAVAAA